MADNNPAGPSDGNNQSSPSSKADSVISEAWDRLKDVKTYFTNNGLKFRKMIAEGHHGGAALFDKFDGANAEVPVKSLVVKYALETADDASSNNDDDLSNEMYWLSKMKYAEHIIQTVPEYWSLWDDPDKKPEGGPGQVLRKPVIVMEYMEHGTLYQLKKRFLAADLRVPNRMIWYFALCSMAYREQFVDVQKTKRERVPKPAEKGGPPPAPSGLAQCSMKGHNVLVADVVPGDSEHDLVPLIKLIDFGRGVEFNWNPEFDDNNVYKEYTGVAYNLDGVGFILGDLLHLGIDSRYDTGTIRWSIEGNEVFEEFNFRTDIDKRLLDNNLIDRLLRDTIALFRARSPGALPTLAEALMLCRVGLKRMKESTNPIDSDEALRDLVQRLVFDADFDSDNFEFEFEDDAWKRMVEEIQAANEGEEEDESMEDNT
ncbi:hypothetical protein PG987_002005 [Apiospora arundinis]